MTKTASVNIGNEIIKSYTSVKLLGITIDNILSFQEHVRKMWRKISQKIHALGRISKYVNSDKLKIIMRTFIENEFNYCPLMWMFHSRTLNNKINKLHERALGVTYADEASTFDKLLYIDGTLTIHEGNLQTLATLMYKVKNNLCPKIVGNIFHKQDIPHNLRNEKVWESGNLRTVMYGTETITYRGPEIWKHVPQAVKEITSLAKFKTQIKFWKPTGCTQLLISYIK